MVRYRIEEIMVRALAVISLLQFVAFGSPVLADESPQTLVARMKEAYASLASYSDSGVVRTYLIPLVSHDITFTTSYVRPGSFKFTWVMPHPFPPLFFIKRRSAIWWNDSGAYFWWEVQKNKGAVRVDDLSSAVARATGVSGGSAPTIASLLIPGSASNVIYRLTSLQSLGVETVEGVACDHLAGEDPKYGRYEFWIGRDDRMLRKIESAVAGTKFEEIRKDVRVNAEIPASVFQSEN